MNKLLKVCGKEIRLQGQCLRTARLEGDGFEFQIDPEEMSDRLRRAEDRIDLFTFMQRLPETTPKYSYFLEWDNFAALRVSTFEHWWRKQIGFKARNKAKQAEKKGVQVREVSFDKALVHGIWQIYNESPVRQGRRFTHYGKDVETVYSDEATFLERSIFIGAFVGQSLIGFVKLVVDESGTQASTMNIISMLKHRDKAPTNALIAQAVRSCADRNISYLAYSQFAYGGKERSTISDFKERNGFSRIEIPRYYIPLTKLGWCALQCGLHKRITDRIPEPVLARLRDYRAAWYSRRFHLIRGIS
jgi:hypothetical protein